MIDPDNFFGLFLACVATLLPVAYLVTLAVIWWRARA